MQIGSKLLDLVRQSFDGFPQAFERLLVRFHLDFLKHAHPFHAGVEGPCNLVDVHADSVQFHQHPVELRSVRNDLVLRVGTGGTVQRATQIIRARASASLPIQKGKLLGVHAHLNHRLATVLLVALAGRLAASLLNFFCHAKHLLVRNPNAMRISRRTLLQSAKRGREQALTMYVQNANIAFFPPWSACEGAASPPPSNPRICPLRLNMFCPTEPRDRMSDTGTTPHVRTSGAF